jgi:hypothetical protein
LRGSAIANHSKILLSQICTMSTFQIARALLMETMLSICIIRCAKMQYYTFKV